MEEALTTEDLTRVLKGLDYAETAAWNRMRSEQQSEASIYYQTAKKERDLYFALKEKIRRIIARTPN
jgi:hypothetical protein